MSTLLEVTHEHIERLNDIQLTQLLRKLLYLETQKFGIESSCAHVALNINVGDGGEDGKINWNNSVTRTDFIPNSHTLFQCKATKMGPSGYADEICDSSKTELKSRVKETWEAGGCYLVFTTQSLNGTQITERTNSIRAKLASLSKSYAQTCEVEIYDASKITTWVNCYYPAVITVLAYVEASSIQGLKVYDFWSQDRDIVDYEYVDVESRRQIITDIRQSLKSGTKSIRIQGVSGLGKTRLAHQIFNNEEELQNSLIYADNEYIADSVALVTEWVNQGLSGIVIIDNCDYKTHNQLAREANRSGSKIQILSLDYTLDKVEASTNVYVLEPLSTEEITSILTLYYDKIISPGDLRRIAEFAQGFPQMAVLLAGARLSNADNLGELDDDHIVEKLLWGRTGEVNEEHLKILQVCALFDWFGVENQRESDLTYISQMAGLGEDGEDIVYACIQHYTGKVINKGGDLRQVVPKPLAIRLASQWWNKTRPTKQSRLVETIPDDLEDSFCSQVSKMDTLPRVKELAESLCGPQAPFGQAEVILSTKGSRFFRSFVEVNPKATSQSIYRIFKSVDDDVIASIVGDVRRNLVWALEMLVFHKSYFHRAAWCLFKLAQHENENFSNNATGQFTQLFRWQLSGTQADFDDRLALLDEIINLDDIKADNIAIAAITAGISPRGGTRTIGAEHQGTKPELEEWRPKVWQEIFDYWDLLVEKLLSLSLKNELLEQIKHSISTNIRGLVQAGRIELLDRAISYIVEKDGKYWPEAIQSVTHVITYDLKGLPEEAKVAVKQWEQLFQPNEEDLEERLKLIVLNPSREHQKDENGHYVDVAAEDAKELAKSLKGNYQELYAHLNFLMNFSEQKQSWVFGNQLALEIDELSDFLNEILNVLRADAHVNTRFLSGFLAGLYHVTPEKWKKTIELIGEDDNLIKFYPDAIRTGKFEVAHLDKFIKLINDGKLPSYTASNLAFGRATEHLNDEEIAQFCDSLSEIDSVGAWVALDNVFMYLHGRKGAISGALNSILVKLVTTVSFKKEDKNRQMDSYNWFTTVEKLLKTENEVFAFNLCIHLIDQVSNNDVDYSDLWDYVANAFYKAFQLHGDYLWPRLADKFLSYSGIKQYRLAELLGSGKSYSDREYCVFDILSESVVLEWCKTKEALLIVGRVISLVISEGDKRIVNPLVISLLSEYGDDKDFTSEISANFNSRSWVGSLVPYLEEDKALLLPLLKHNSSRVKEWAVHFIESIDYQIEYETKRELERKIRQF